MFEALLQLVDVILKFIYATALEAAAFFVLMLVVAFVKSPFTMIGDAIERRRGRHARHRIAWITGGTIVFLMWAVPVGIVIWGHVTGRL